MKRFIASLWLVILLPFALVAKGKLAEYLPANAWMTMEIDDLESLFKDLEKGPFGELWNSPGMKKGREYLEKEFSKNAKDQSAKEFFERIKEWSDKFSGQVAFGFGGVENLLEKDENDKPGVPELILLAETEITPKELEEFIRWMEKEVEENADQDGLLVEKEQVVDEDVFFLSPSQQSEDKERRVGVFVIDGVFGIGGGRSTIEGLVKSLADDPAGGLTENPDYRDVFDEIGSGDVRFFLNFRRLGKVLDFVRLSDDTQVPENPFGVTTEGILDALGFEGLDCLGLQMDFDEEGMEIGTALFMSKREGLLKLLRLPDGEATLAPFVPSGVTTATVARYDFGAVWPVLEEIIGKISPALHLMINTQVQAFETKAGVNVRKDLLGAFGDEIVTFSDVKALDPEALDSGELPMGEFYAISLRDSEVFDRALRTIVDTFAPGTELFQDREHKGVTVRTMRGTEAAGFDLSYAITPKWLLVNVGERSRMLRAISRMDKSRKTLWKKPAVVAALREAPEGVKQWDYVDFDTLMGFLLPLLDMAFEENTGESFFDGDMPELPYFMLSWTRDLKRGFVSKAKLFPKEKR